MNGILLVNKEKGYTSRDVVNIVSKTLNTKKIGHTGTLDPLATGVLVLCVGNATKICEILTSNIKEYEAVVELGTLTDTLDCTGNILKKKKTVINEEKIIDTLKKMTKTYNQEVPIYSAVKVKGKKLYEYARNNEYIKLPEKKVTIYSIDLISDITYKNDKTYFKIKTVVSKGTYIRSLIRDIGLSLDTFGNMIELNRTRQGKFNLENCYSLEDIENGNYSFINIEDVLDEYKKIKVDTYLENKIKNGSILENKYNQDIIVFIDNNDKVISIYKKYDKDISKIKPWKMFL